MSVAMTGLMTLALDTYPYQATEITSMRLQFMYA